MTGKENDSDIEELSKEKCKLETRANTLPRRRGEAQTRNSKATEGSPLSQETLIQSSTSSLQIEQLATNLSRSSSCENVSGENEKSKIEDKNDDDSSFEIAKSLDKEDNSVTDSGNL